jgi:hypothetical protein
VPGADDQAIFADIVGPLGHDRNAVRQVLAMLRETAGGDFASLLPTPLKLAFHNRRQHQEAAVDAV